MLVGFRDSLQDCQFPGKDARNIALGMDFIARMIEQSKIQIEYAKSQEKEMMKRAKDAIKDAGGQVNAATTTESQPA